MAIDRLGVGLVAVAMFAMFGGCATPALPEISPDASLFEHDASAPENRALRRVALAAPPQVRDKTVEVANRIRLKAGAIVEQALLAASGDSAQGGVQLVHVPLSADAQFSATLVIQAVRFDYEEHLVWLVPIPLPVVGFAITKREASTQLGFDLTLLDAQARPVWTRTYADSAGHFVWIDPPEGKDERWPHGIGRLAHEAAWRLSQQALRDLREWLAEERMKPRQL
jgi:hypothetical protein